MKYDDLHLFRSMLDQEPSIKKSTAKKYYFSVKKILAPLNFDNVSEIEPAALERGLKELKTKNDVSAAKCGLQHMARYFPEMRLPESICEISKHKRNYKKRTWKPLKMDKLNRKVNSLRNKKLKYGYRLMLATGMRVSEVAQIRKENITFSEDKLEFYIEDTKSGEPALISCHDMYLVDRMPEFTSQLEKGDKVFYSTSTMMNQAGVHGFECHDLRRTFSKQAYRKCIKSGMRAYRATRVVGDLMRHKSCRTTLKYLRRK